MTGYRQFIFDLTGLYNNHVSGKIILRIKTELLPELFGGILKRNYSNNKI